MDPFPLLDELAVLARNGRHFAADPYDEKRYERILELVEEYYGETLDLPTEVAEERLRQRLGYSLSAAVAVFDEGRILLMKRVDNGTWCLPGGMVEPHESPEVAAVREVKEETGLDVRIVDQHRAYFDRPTVDGTPHSHVHVVYHGEVEGGELRLSEEGTALDYRGIDDVPEWNQRDEEYARRAREEWVSRRR